MLSLKHRLKRTSPRNLLPVIPGMAGDATHDEKLPYLKRKGRERFHRRNRTQLQLPPASKYLSRAARERRHHDEVIENAYLIDYFRESSLSGFWFLNKRIKVFVQKMDWLTDDVRTPVYDLHDMFLTVDERDELTRFVAQLEECPLRSGVIVRHQRDEAWWSPFWIGRGYEPLSLGGDKIAFARIFPKEKAPVKETPSSPF